MLKRVFFIICGLVLISVPIYLGIKTTADTSLVLWYGLASAILVPIGLLLITESAKQKDRVILKQLSKVSEIEKLIQNANTQEERIKLLTKERERIVETVRYEVRKQAIAERKGMLEQEGAKIITELKAIDEEIESNKYINEHFDTTQMEIRELNERLKARERGDILLPLGKLNINLTNIFGMFSVSLISTIFTISDIIKKSREKK